MFSMSKGLLLTRSRIDSKRAPEEVLGRRRHLKRKISFACFKCIEFYAAHAPESVNGREETEKAIEELLLYENGEENQLYIHGPNLSSITNFGRIEFQDLWSFLL